VPGFAFAPGSTFASGTRTSSKNSSDVTDARSEYFRRMSRATKAGIPFSTRNPRTPSSVIAQTTATSASVPLVIHVFAPRSTQSPPRRTACVFIVPGSLPPSRSVRAKQPMASAFASRGSQRCFCSSLP
jgi:hypothetical protein